MHRKQGQERFALGLLQISVIGILEVALASSSSASEFESKEVPVKIKKYYDFQLHMLSTFLAAEISTFGQMSQFENVKAS